MMSTLLFLLLLSQVLTPAQETAGQPDGPPLEVLDADVAAYVPRPATQPELAPNLPPSPVTRDALPGQRDTVRRSDKTSITSRSADLRDAESRGRSSKAAGGPASGYQYEYRVRVKNVSSKKVTSLVWEYRLLDSPVAAASRRLFQCAGGLKPGETKRLSAWTPLAPVTVVSADGAAGMTPKAEVFVNRVEYDDGSAWQREGWEPGEAKTVNPSGAGRGKLRRGECAAW